MNAVRHTAAAALLCLAGCMVGPNYQRPDIATPASFGELAPAHGESELPAEESGGVSRATEHPFATEWWTAFDDQELTSLIGRAIEGNLDVQQAEARIRQARASRQLTASALWPQVEASGDYTREHTSANGVSPAPSGQSFNLFQVGFDANWEIDVFGGIRRSVEAADATVQAAVDDRNAVLVSLMAEVGLEYVTYRSLQQQIVLADQNLEAQQSTLDLTRRLFNAGLAPELDVTRAVSQVATTGSTIPTLKQQAAQAMHRLGVLLGEAPMTLRAELEPIGTIPAPPSQVPIGLPSDLLLRRPDIARFERQLAAATAQIGVATADLFPRFFITGTAGLQSIHGSDLFNWQSRLASIGPSITWPVFEGGAIRANIALQTATQEERLAAYENVVLQALQEVEDALVAFSHEQDTRDQLGTAVRANQLAAELARRLYAQGLTDFLTVLDAERSLFESQETLAQSEQNVALNLIALYKAVGGGWEVAATSQEDSLDAASTDRPASATLARQRPTATADQMASTMPNGHAP